MYQVENEYGNTKEPDQETDKVHLLQIKQLFEEAGLVELYFTSDTPSKGKEYGAIPGGKSFAQHYLNSINIKL